MIFEKYVNAGSAYIRFMNYELKQFLGTPSKLLIPKPPSTIYLNFDVTGHADGFADFLTSEDVFGGERYELRVEKPVQEEEFWAQLIDVSIYFCWKRNHFRNTKTLKILPNLYEIVNSVS